MKVTVPVPITSVRLISTSVDALHAPAVYDAGTTYTSTALVSVAADYRIYQSLINSNLGNTPSLSPDAWLIVGYTETAYSAGTTYALGATASANKRICISRVASNLGNPFPTYPATENTWWRDVGPVNQYAMFDTKTSTQTVALDSITATVKPGQRVTTVGITGMEATTLTISATSVAAGGTVFGPLAVDLDNRVVDDHYDFVFAPLSFAANYINFDLPLYSDIEVTVTLERPGGIVKCGSLVVGNSTYIGAAQYGAEVEDLNFSTITRDATFGTATLVPRPGVPKATLTLVAPSSSANEIRAVKRETDAVPALYTGVEEATSDWFDALFIQGVWKTWGIKAPYAQDATINLIVEGI